MTGEPSIPGDRLPPLDVARGLAVLGMVWLHLVAAEGGADLLERAATTVAAALYGKPAALFCVLAGVSWAIQAERWGPQWAHVLRRAGVLAAFGVLFGRTVWPTEILTPLALMMPLTLLAWRGGPRALVASLALVLAVVPVARGLFGDLAWSDWTEDGAVHRAEHAFGLVTLRYYLYTGNYPLCAWLAFPLCGALAVRLGLLERARARRAVRWLVPAAVLVGAAVWFAEVRADALGALGPYLTASWVPTSVPFVLAGGTTALAVIAVALAVGARVRALADVGRTSLTHYVLHVLVAFVPLRASWPDEDWPIAVGAAAALGYTAVAVPLSRTWLRRFRRGPLEAAWAWLAPPRGRRRRA